MGSTPKTLERLKYLTSVGALPAGGSICDIGATQLFGDETQDGSRAFLSYYAERFPHAKRPEEVAPEMLRSITQNGFLGDLLTLAGFEYKALDIFHATNTILFDLNVHEPGPGLVGRFDLVMNFGTTEHVFNQLRAFQTIHALMKVNGLCYHDLPMAGYLNHALYRYDPLFFTTIVPANRYEVIMEQITSGAERAVAPELNAMGYKDGTVTDVGIEMIYRRSTPDPFAIPMETSTSIAVDPTLSHIEQDEYVRTPTGSSVSYGTNPTLDALSFAELTSIWLSRLKRGLGRRLLRS
ncbi:MULTISPECIES: hypothetical protein [unclassified Bradyrhizobium]